MSVLVATEPVPTPVRRPATRAWITLAPAALTLALGLWGIRRRNTLWGDEAVTYDLAHRTLPQIWATAQHIDLVHALYYAVMHAVFTAFGDGLVPLRLPSVLATTAAAAGVTALGVRLAGPRAGLLAGLAFAVLPQVQKYAQEGRSYAMVCALITWATLALVTPTRWRWPLYGSTMLLACLLHEFAALALAAHGTTLLVSRVPRRVLRAWSLTAASVITGLLPLAIRSAGQSAQLAWIESPVRLPGVLLMTAVAAACALTPPRARGPVHLTALALPLAVLPTLLLLLASLAKPLFVDRYVLYSTTGTALLLGACLDHTLRRTPLITYAALLTALTALIPPSLTLRTPESRTNNATAITAAILQAARPGDGLLYLPTHHRTLTTPTAPLPTDLALSRTPTASNTLTGIEFPAEDIAARMLRFDRILVLHTNPAPPTPQDQAKTNTLHHHFRPHTSTQLHGARITVYVRRTDKPPSAPRFHSSEGV
ncbi:glycosyltransferase family 39 protein [Streptomyces niveiscabiei]|uniref:glycosyltransferase family 39 protein n=1 Tax=Streptomyces niveiscabiei TaxID=164115 RepID=UPI0029A44B84|nr:glycosyltransferase family 39 protein [Streptomyces niveiscabiei]MDX3387453.1 glycosyltransferase family 39 protein [Streptomyces niveiscabiei]